MDHDPDGQGNTCCWNAPTHGFTYDVLHMHATNPIWNIEGTLYNNSVQVDSNAVAGFLSHIEQANIHSGRILPTFWFPGPYMRIRNGTIGRNGGFETRNWGGVQYFNCVGDCGWLGQCPGSAHGPYWNEHVGISGRTADCACDIDPNGTGCTAATCCRWCDDNRYIQGMDDWKLNDTDSSNGIIFIDGMANFRFSYGNTISIMGPTDADREMVRRTATVPTGTLARRSTKK
jgi:hypothetical protein